MSNNITIKNTAINNGPVNKYGCYQATTTRVFDGCIQYQERGKVHVLHFSDMKVHAAESFHVSSLESLNTPRLSFDHTDVQVNSPTNPKINSWSSSIRTPYMPVSSLHLIKAALANFIRFQQCQ